MLRRREDRKNLRMEEGKEVDDDDDVREIKHPLMDSTSTFGLFVLFGVVFLDLVSVGLIYPLLPFYVERVGGNMSDYGAIVSIYGICQLVGSPLMGRLSDLFGRRFVLLLSLFAGGISYVMLPFASTLWMLFACRIPVGLVKQTMTTSNAIVAELTQPIDRSQYLGYMSTAASAGFFVGPMIGGMISSISMDYPAYISGGIYVINICIVVFLLPKGKYNHAPTAHTEDSAGFAENQRETRFVSFKNNILRALSGPLARLLLLSFIASFSNITFKSNLQPFTMNQFHLNPKTIGFMTSYISALQTVVQMFLVGLFTKNFSEKSLILMASFMNLFSILCLLVTTDFNWFMMILIPLIMSAELTETCITSLLTTTAPRQRLGSVLGVASSLSSVCRALSPYLGTLLMELYGTTVIPFLVASILGNNRFYE